MNYQWHYDRLIETRTCRIIDKEAYYEHHHIIPHSMGGENTDENLIYLTAREHFLAHWLLWRIHRNRQMAFAFRSMCNYKNKKLQGLNRQFSSIGYAESREAFIIKMRETLSGIKKSTETRQKLSIARKKYHATFSDKERSDKMKLVKSYMTEEQRLASAAKAVKSYGKERRSATAKKINASLTDEQRLIKKDKCSKARSSYWSKLTAEEKSERMKQLNEAKKIKRQNNG